MFSVLPTAPPAAGADPFKAAELGSLVAEVTIQKPMQTGTAALEEILKIGVDPDRCYRQDPARQHEGKVGQKADED